MSFYTKTEARQAAQNTLRKSFNKTSVAALSESIRLSTDYDSFDIFLSHSFKDAELILGVKSILESQGFKVYVDWHDDPQASRENVTKETADMLRKRMRQSKSLIYTATDNSTTSKWMPWELGYFDGYKPRSVAILPLVDNDYSQFIGQEYLSLYPVVEKRKDTSGQDGVFVFSRDRIDQWDSLYNFGHGISQWRNL